MCEKKFNILVKLAFVKFKIYVYIEREIQTSTCVCMYIHIIYTYVLTCTYIHSYLCIYIGELCIYVYMYMGIPCWLSGKQSACQCRRYGFNPWVGKILLSSAWQPTAVFLPGESHGQRSLVGCCAWDCQRVGHDLAIKQKQYMHM